MVISFCGHWANGSVVAKANGEAAELYPAPQLNIEEPLEFSSDHEAIRRATTNLQLSDGTQISVDIVIPPGNHAARSLPCVIQPSDNADLLTREWDGILTQTSQPVTPASFRHGFVEISYDAPNFVRSSATEATVETMRNNAIRRFHLVEGGILTSRFALSAAFTIPEVNPDQIYASGRGVNGLHALLLAAHDPRIRGCIVEDPIVQIDAHFTPEQLAQARKFVDLSHFAVRHSPATHVAHYRCAILFSGSPQTFAAPATEAFLQKLQQRGVSVERTTPERLPQDAADWLVRMGAKDPPRLSQ